MFKWDLSTVKSAINNEKEEDKRYFFHINVNTDVHVYNKETHSWEKDEEKSATLKKQIVEVAQKYGYDIEIPIDSADCTSTRQNRVSALYNMSWNYCYFHPMDFSGYGTKKFIEDMEKIASEVPSVTSHNKPTTEYILPLNEYDYGNLINRNIPNILKYFAEEVGDNEKCVGTDFAARYRLPVLLDERFGTQTISSDNIDAQIVESLYQMYKTMSKNNLIDKDKLNEFNSSLDEKETEEELDR